MTSADLDGSDPARADAPAPQPSAALVHEQVAAHAAGHPADLAVSDGDTSLSYAELITGADAVAAELRSLGVAPGATVGLCLSRSAALAVGALGIFRAGGAYVALDPANPDERLELMLADSTAAAVVTDPAGARRVAGPRRPAVLVGASRRAGVGADPGPRVSRSDLAYVVYTSGSTGQPKGVMVEHGNLLNLVSWHRRRFSIGRHDRASMIASPGFDASVWETWPHLTAGASLHVPAEDLRTDPARLRDWMVAERITLAFAPTALAEEMMALSWPAQAALRFLLTGGDALRRYPDADLPFAVINNYGPAETTVVATSGPVPLAHGAAAAPSIGRPIDGVTVRIVDSALTPVPSGSAGELLIGGAGVARGYLNHPELTAERFVPDPGLEGGGLVYRSGDLVRLRPDGELEFIGRVDDQVQIRGRRIEPGEVAATLDRHPSVRTSAVVAIGDLPPQRRLMACVVAADGAARDDEVLRAHLRRSLPDHMIPSGFVWLEQLPLTPSGKVDRAALRSRLASPDPRDTVGTAPRNDLEAALAGIVAELLGLTAVGVDEDFFLLGGHSLLGAQVITRIGDAYGVELPLRDLFESPTVAGMAAAVERLLVAQLEGMTDEEAERLAGDPETGLFAGTGR